MKPQILLAPEGAVAAPPPAPATPSPAAPAAASAPSPNATPSSTPASDPIQDFEKSLHEKFDKASPIDKKPDPAPAPAKPKEAPKPTQQTPTPPPSPKDPKELRNELATKTKQIAEMETRIKEYESKGKDSDVLHERLTALEKREQELLAENRAFKQESSPEFQDKYEKPFWNAANRAEKVIKQLQMTDPTTGTERLATMNDLKSLWGLDPGEQAAKASQMFGHAAPRVLAHLIELEQLQDIRNTALEAERTGYKEKEAAEQAKKIQERDEWQKLSQKVRGELAQSVEDYQDNPEDKEASKVRNDAYALFDEKPASKQDLVIKNAHIRHRFAAFSVMKLQLLRAQRELAEAKGELETYQTKVPNPGARRGGKEGQPESEDWETAARKALA